LDGDITNGTNDIAYAIGHAFDYWDFGFSLWPGMDALWRVGGNYSSPMLFYTNRHGAQLFLQ